MDRRKFIEIYGMFFTATTLLSFNSSISEEINDVVIDDKEKRDDYKLLNIPIIKAFTIGLNAPSAHNTQPWKFEIINPLVGLLYVDETKLLPKTDPSVRQIHISCGCFIEALAIGCSGIGFESEITLFPNDLYKHEDIGKKPVALIKLTQNKSLLKHPLFDYIFQRKTNRSIYYSDSFSKEDFEMVKQNCNIFYSQIAYFKDSKEIENYKSFFSKAMQIEFNTLSTNEETRRMFRFNKNEAKIQRDGLTFEANGLNGLSLFFAKAFTKNTIESWNNKLTIEKGLANFNKSLDSSRDFIFFTTTNNTLLDQINVGRDFYQFCLSLAKNGFYCHPLNQVIQEYSEMDNIRKEFEKLTKTNEIKKIQMIIRIGRAKKPYKSYRRHIYDFIVQS